MTAVQRETPCELLGRVAATAGTLMFAPTGLALAAGLDYRVQPLLAGTTGLAAAAALTLTTRRPSPRPRPRPRSPAGSAGLRSGEGEGEGGGGAGPAPGRGAAGHQ